MLSPISPTLFTNDPEKISDFSNKNIIFKKPEDRLFDIPKDLIIKEAKTQEEYMSLLIQKGKGGENNVK
ncbi:MAG: hypothetical protein ABH873_04220 [Candidatus Firestonebacteria bacterium]